MSQDRFPGEILRERRERCGLSVFEVYEHTHVAAKHIQALEDGDLDALPGLTYALGFLNTYCQFLELDPDPLIDCFRACAQPPATTRLRVFPDRLPDTGRRPPWLGEVMAWAAICGILLLGWLTYAVVMRPLAESEDIRVDAGTVEIVPPTHFEEDL